MIGCSTGRGAHDLDLVFTGDHVGRHVHAQGPAAAHEHRRLFGCGAGGARHRRPRRIRPREQPARESFEPHPHVAIEPDRIDAADVRPAHSRPPAPGLGKQGCDEPPAAARRTAVAKLHYLGGTDLEFRQLDIAGHDLDLVVGVGPGGRAADRDLPAEAAPHELREPALPEVERFVELEHRALRSPQHDRATGPALVGRTVAIGEHHERAGHEVHAAVRQRMVLLEEQPHLPALEHDRIIALPRAFGKHVAQGREPFVGAGPDGGRLLRRELERGRRVRDPRLHPGHDREPVEPRCGKRDEEHPQRASEAMFHGGRLVPVRQAAVG